MFSILQLICFAFSAFDALELFDVDGLAVLSHLFIDCSLLQIAFVVFIFVMNEIGLIPKLFSAAINWTINFMVFDFVRYNLIMRVEF